MGETLALIDMTSFEAQFTEADAHVLGGAALTALEASAVLRPPFPEGMGPAPSTGYTSADGTIDEE